MGLEVLSLRRPPCTHPPGELVPMYDHREYPYFLPADPPILPVADQCRACNAVISRALVSIGADKG